MVIDVLPVFPQLFGTLPLGIAQIAQLEEYSICKEVIAFVQKQILSSMVQVASNVFIQNILTLVL